MSDDIETLRTFLFGCNCELAALDRLVADRDRLQGRVGTLQKALDDRHADDLKAWSAIMRATGRERGIPPNKEVIAFYVAEVERLEKERDGAKSAYANILKLLDRNANRASAIDADRDYLRAKLDRATAILKEFPRRTPKAGGCSTEHDFQIPASTVWENDAFLSELSADAPATSANVEDLLHEAREAVRKGEASPIKALNDAPAQQTQISDEVREAMVEAEKALGEVRDLLCYKSLNTVNKAVAEANVNAAFHAAEAGRAKLRSVMK